MATAAFRYPANVSHARYGIRSAAGAFPVFPAKNISAATDIHRRMRTASERRAIPPLKKRATI